MDIQFGRITSVAVILLLHLLMPACGGSGGGGSQQAAITLLQSDGTTTVSEAGTSDSFSLVLTSPPDENVIIDITADNQTSVSPTALLFTPSDFDNPRTVTVSAVDDGVPEGPHVSTISFAISSNDVRYGQLGISDIVASISDDDVPGVGVSQTGAGTQVSENGGTDSYALVLTSQPGSDVTVNVTPDNELTPSPSVLVFTSLNWNIPQDVTLTAVNDADIEGLHTSFVAHNVTSADQAYDGVAVNGVLVDVIDNDVVTSFNFAAMDSYRRESDGAVTVPVRIDLNGFITTTLPTSVSVDLVALGSGTAAAVDDYVFSTTTLTFPAGSVNGTVQDFIFSLVNDNVAEGLEVIDLQLVNPVGAATQTGSNIKHRMAVQDDDRGGLMAVDAQSYGGFFASRLLSVDPQTAQTRRVSGWGLKGFKVTSLTYDAGKKRFYSVIRNELVVFDPQTGEGAPLAPTLDGMVLAFDNNNDILYGSDASSLYTIDTQTGLVSKVGDFNPAYTGVVAMAFDPAGPTLYGADILTNELISINTVDATVMSIGPQGINNVNSLAHDGADLYGVSTTDDRLYTFDTGTGSATAVSATPTGFATVFALAYDSDNGTLYGSDVSKETFITIDTTSGVGTAHSINAFNKSAGLLLAGLAHDPNHNMAYSVHTDGLGNPTLVAINTMLGTSRSIAPITGIAGLIDDLAYDDDTDRLYAVASGNLYYIDTQSGVATSVGATGSNPVGLAYDTNTMKLYATDASGDLLTLNRNTGSTSAIGATGFSSVDGLAFDSVNNTLYGINTDNAGQNPQLVTIDVATGVATARPEGVMFEDLRTGLMFDSNSNKLYGLNHLGLLDFDTSMGKANSVGQMGVDYFAAMAYDRNNNILYGVASDSDDNKLLSVDIDTGITTPIAALGGTGIDGLAYDPNALVLYGVSVASKELVSIDVSTGAVNVIDVSPENALGGGLAYDSNSDKLYGIAIGVADVRLIEINTSNATTASAVVISDALSGLAYDQGASTLYGINPATNSLVSVDTVTGAFTTLGPMDYPGALGLAWID